MCKRLVEMCNEKQHVRYGFLQNTSELFLLESEL